MFFPTINILRLFYREVPVSLQLRDFAGHSKWSKIKRKKGLNDQKRSALFAKMTNEIISAANAAGGELQNLRLTAAIQRAKSNNMPKGNIESALQKATDPKTSGNYEDVLYEGYGPGVTATLVQCLTDNRKRTAPAIRHIFSKQGGHLGETGSVSWMFERKGSIILDIQDQLRKDEFQYSFLEMALEAGAEDVDFDESAVFVTCAHEELAQVRENFLEKGYTPTLVDTMYIPSVTVSLDESQQEKLLHMLEALDDNMDVQHVYHNAEFSN